MPTLPSGRRVEFSLDRFHAALQRMPQDAACLIVSNLQDPDDLLFVMDAVHFSLAEGSPYFAGYVAADWQTRAADWPTADRQTLQAWFASPTARAARAEAIEYLHGLYFGMPDALLPYPYLVQDGLLSTASLPTASTLRQ